MSGSGIFVLCRRVQKSTLSDRRSLTFISTYLTLSTDPLLTCNSNKVEPFTCRTLRTPDSHMRLNRGSGGLSCEGMTAPMDHSFRGKWIETLLAAAFPFEGLETETKPDDLVASMSSCRSGNGRTLRWTHSFVRLRVASTADWVQQTHLFWLHRALPARSCEYPEIEVRRVRIAVSFK
jgi:hypothetical protein